MTLMRFYQSARRWTARLTALLVMAAGLFGVQVAGQFAMPADAATAGAPPHLLLIHGYTDSCGQAFDSTGSYSWDGGSTTQANDSTTLGYLTGNTGWARPDITTVGYYNSDSDCDLNLNTSTGNWGDDTVGCNLDWQPSTLPPGSNGDPFGTYWDPVMHLACLFAWYIYDTYTKTGRPVEILAHSMGGLITRAAIGGSNAGAAGFPQHALLVPDVVDVATPNGGIGGIEATAAWWANQGTEEVSDMQPGSGFMNTMGSGAYERPQGTGGTHWALIGSSVPSGPPSSTTYNASGCLTAADVPASSSLARVLSCLQWGIDGDTYPDGDGVVNAMSQMAMPADYKVLYGAVENTSTFTLSVADTATEYEHETSTCQQILGGPPHTCAQAPFYLNDGMLPNPADPSTYTKAFVCASNCTATTFSDLDLGSPVTVPHSLAVIASQLPAPAPWIAGHAVNAGDDYPYETVGQFGHISEGTDAWNEFYGQCDSFAAWKVYENLAGSSAQHPTGSIPAVGWKPSNASVSPVNQFTWGPNGGPYGNADVWESKFTSLGYAVDNAPAPGSIAYWPNAVTDPQDGNPPDPVRGMASTGHVAFVSDVYPDGSITIENYNIRGNGEFSVVHLRYGQSYTDNSFGLPDFTVPWPTAFIHVGDGPSGQASPAEPAVGVVQAGYAGQSTQYSSPRPGLTVIGPGDGDSDFTLAGAAYPGTVHGWYSDGGHGEIGQMLWTNTHPGAADSTATWSPALTASACYRVDAFVPDNWSNNDAAVYTVTDQYFGTSRVPVDENRITNDWAELGIFESRSDGSLPVELTDQGSGTGQVAADAMRYIKQPGCSGVVRASQTIDYGNGMQFAGASYPGTIDGWYANSGAGQLGDQYWTYTNGMTPGSSATWTASVIPNACYELWAYVPGNHSDDYQAQYTISTATSTPVISVDENAYTNAFAALGTYESTSAGKLTVKLTDQSLASGDAYIAADTVSFVNVPCSSEVVEGATYPALTEGPGSPLAQFSLGADWYNEFGYGDLGYAKWTHTNGATAVSTAKWTFTGLPASTTYFVCAYIPDNDANNTVAHYEGFYGSSTTPMFESRINQANLAGWGYLGLIETDSTGKIHVTLDDTGPTGTYTAADAVRLSTSGC